MKPRYEWRPRLNPYYALNRNLVAYWLLNESSGLKAYDLVKGMDLTLNMSYLSWEGDKVNTAAASGTNQPGSCSIRLNNIDFGFTNELTYEIEIIPATHSYYQSLLHITESTRHICNFGFDNATLKPLLLIGKESDGGFAFQVFDDALTAGVRYIIIATYKGSTDVYSLYVNGVKKPTKTGANPGIWNGTPDKIGFGNDNVGWSEPFKGKTFRIALYNRCLTDSEAEELYLHPFGTRLNPRFLVEPRALRFAPLIAQEYVQLPYSAIGDDFEWD